MKQGIVWILVTFLFTSTILSCKNVNSKQDEKTHELIIYNESIQSNFFGFSFGDSPKVVVQKLNESYIGSYDREIANGRMTFFTGNHDKIQFGGYMWDFIYVYFSNNQLYGIKFHNVHKTMEFAVDNYTDLTATLSDKYYMQKTKMSDTCYGWTKNNQYVEISYGRYEGRNGNENYGSFLSYYDFNYQQNNALNEL